VGGSQKPRSQPVHPTEHAPVEGLIANVRGQRVILAADLAAIYGVETRVLNQAVKRNPDRFPPDFVFRISRDEAAAILALRSQSVILKRGRHLKYDPLAFTEHGAVMAATVLNSPRAVRMSIFVVRAFLRLREWVNERAELSAKLAELERRVGTHDQALNAIIRTLREMVEGAEPERRRIGFASRVPIDHHRPPSPGRGEGDRG